MGRNLTGGSSVSDPSSGSGSGSSSSSTSGGRPERTRVQGLPLIAHVGRQNSDQTSPVGMEVLDSFGQKCTPHGLYQMEDNYKISAYSTSNEYAYGYAGGNSSYQNPFYMGGNTSNNNYHAYNGQGNVSFFNKWSPLGHTYFTFGLNWNENRPYFKRHKGNNSYGGSAPSNNGVSVIMDSGSWIGPEGTRQEHSIIKPYNYPLMYIYRNVGGESKQFTDYRYKSGPDPDKAYDPNGYDASVDKDIVNIFDYIDGKDGTNNQEKYPTGTRFSYNENLNMLVWVSGYSSYSSNSRVYSWTGASDKNLYDTPLRDWLEAATQQDHGLIQSGFNNMSSAGGYSARVWLCNNKDLVIAWKSSNNNYCYRISGLEENNCVGHNMSVSGSTTSYDREQGNNEVGNSYHMSWDNKWVFWNCSYYHYHCGARAICFSLENPQLYYRFDNNDTNVAYTFFPYGKSGFTVQNQGNWTSTNAYSCIFDFSMSKAYFDDEGKYYYGMRYFSYANGFSATRNAMPSDYAAYPNSYGNDFQVANGMIMRTNLGSSPGSLDNACSTWQGFPTRRSEMRVPTQRGGVVSLDYWYKTVPMDDRDNSKDRY